MWAFILGLMLGAAAKAIYDLFREEQLPAGLGLNTGRLEALAEETRQAVSSLRDEVRQLGASGRDSVQETASRLLGSSAGTDQGTNQGGAAESGPAGGERLTVTASEPAGSASATSAQAGARTGSASASGPSSESESANRPRGGAPPPTYGTAETMS